MLPGIERHFVKKLYTDPMALFNLISRWRFEAERKERVVLALEAGRDGLWLARWLRERGIEAHVIHSTSLPVMREHRRAKTDRLDTAMLMRVFSIDPVKEAQGPDDLVERGSENPGRNQMYLEGTDVFKSEPIGRVAKISAEL